MGLFTGPIKGLLRLLRLLGYFCEAVLGWCDSEGKRDLEDDWQRNHNPASSLEAGFSFQRQKALSVPSAPINAHIVS
jgi:hypothetical protein